jgi:hypothetical protein
MTELFKPLFMNPGDLVTLKGLKNAPEKPVGMVIKIIYGKKNKDLKLVKVRWLTEKLARRHGLRYPLQSCPQNKIEVISEAAKKS